MNSPIRTAVVGAGQFGSHHARVAAAAASSRLVAVVDANSERARQIAEMHGCEALTTYTDLLGKVDAAVVAVPTVAHAEVACALMATGIDVLVEKPMAPDLESADRMICAARQHGRILQIGHLERFNPAVLALETAAQLPLFFEIHRMSVFTPRCLDVDVVLDLMIHDLDIVMALVESELVDVRAAGISILSSKVDIANVRLEFRNGCVANLTASRASTEKVRKLRVFCPGEYISLDYARQELLGIRVTESREISFYPYETKKDEPLRLQFEAFLESVKTRQPPKVDGVRARRSLEVALAITGKIAEHGAIVSQTVEAWKQ
jgi:predicted dehydrogenase